MAKTRLHVSSSSQAYKKKAALHISQGDYPNHAFGPLWIFAKTSAALWICQSVNGVHAKVTTLHKDLEQERNNRNECEGFMITVYMKYYTWSTLSTFAAYYAIHNMIIETLKTVIILPAWNSNNFYDNIRILIDRAMYTLIADCHAA